MNIASIIIDNSSREVDRPFEYKIPTEFNDLVKIGIRVVVPFGKVNKHIEGYVIEVKNSSEYDIDKLKNIEDVLDDTVYFDDEMTELAYFVKEKYNCTLSEAFNLILPSGIKFKEKLFFKLKDIDLELIDKKYKNIIPFLKKDSFIDLNQLKKISGVDYQVSTIYKMEREGIIDIKKEIVQNTRVKKIDIYTQGDIDLCNEFIKKYEVKRKKQVSVLKRIIINKDKLPLGELLVKYNCSSSIIKALVDAGVLIKSEKELYRNPSSKEFCYGRVNLTEDQREAIKSILQCYYNGKNISLIHGVTGCGKTEIYLNLVEKYINEGYGAIVLVPEISLTPQTLERFKGRFGDTVAILHSKLSSGERYDEWRRIKEGKVRVVVGARSAVFAPIKNLKLIIIDEEHEYSYKSESSPKYYTRDVAEFRINYKKGLMVLGSATPSLESYYKAINGEYNLIEIKSRVNNIKLPKIDIIDMREELKGGNKSIFSRELLKGIEENLKLGQQTILFLNRRGYSTFVSCRECGYVCKCTNCDVSLTYHINTDKLICHYCGMEYNNPKLCPKCKSKYIKYFGAGTEKIEKEVKANFPQARVLRMDMDTTRRKGQHEKIYNDFKSNKADILIGTQMISKGMDFKNVSLVGIIAADMTLNLPDFRAPERTFQLITQVSGRAGRGEVEGKVIVQTYDSEHYSILFAQNNDYKGFYNREIDYRRALNNPPFTDILYILLTSEKENELIKYCKELEKKLINLSVTRNIKMLGPSPCNVSKIKNLYRWHIIFKGNVYPCTKDINDIIYNSLVKDVSVSMDVNPYNMI